MPLEWLSMNETHAPQGIERTLIYATRGSASDTVALIYVNPQRRNLILGWPLGETKAGGPNPPSGTPGLSAASTIKLIDLWLSTFLPIYQFNPSTTSIEAEFYVAGDYYSKPIQPPVLSRKIISEVSSVKITPTDRLGILVLKAGSNILELSYDEKEQAVQGACLINEARLQALIPLFRSHHQNPDIRGEVEISLRAFGDPTRVKSSFSALSPIPVVH
jgi:hypothetical protein